jgi:hypothetical protein
MGKVSFTFFLEFTQLKPTDINLTENIPLVWRQVRITPP